MLFRSERIQYAKTSLAIRKNLSFAEWEELGGILANIGKGWPWWVGDWVNYGETRWGEKYAQAIDNGFDYGTVRNAAWVASRVDVSRRRDKLSWSHHQVVAPLKPREQTLWLDKAEANGWTRSELRDALRASQQLPTPPLPAGQFHVLYADPPWRYDFAASPDRRQIENHYPTMTLAEIKALDIPASDDAVLFLWATSPKLAEALEVIEAWGFEYRTCMVWVKDKIGMGYYARQRHELLLVAKRGNLPVPEPGLRPDSVIEAPRLDHSAKPPVVYDMLESMYPEATKAELFARNQRDGWTGWGNEL